MGSIVSGVLDTVFAWGAAFFDSTHPEVGKEAMRPCSLHPDLVEKLRAVMREPTFVQMRICNVTLTHRDIRRFDSEIAKISIGDTDKLTCQVTAINAAALKERARSIGLYFEVKYDNTRGSEGDVTRLCFTPLHFEQLSDFQRDEFNLAKNPFDLAIYDTSSPKEPTEREKLLRDLGLLRDTD
ncbi:MAG: hypothetical protein K9M07_05935 [Simkaniaceae bacterium]|nr:hypothetical protein [Simkaniaceae bacterium]MCF7852761.1 hypothetical protein [Simkaniaceae bacterium]